MDLIERFHRLEQQATPEADFPLSVYRAERELLEALGRLPVEYQGFPFGVKWWLARINDATTHEDKEKTFLEGACRLSGHREKVFRDAGKALTQKRP